MATYTPDGDIAYDFHLLVDPPDRETRQTMSERVFPGSPAAVVDIIGRPLTKIRGTARFDSFDALKTFEVLVGTTGTLAYSEEPGGIPVIFVSVQRRRVTPSDIHLADVEFWIISVYSGYPPPRFVNVVATADTASSGSIGIQDVLSAQVSYGFDQRTGECRLVTATKPNCTYDDVLTVAMGAGGIDGTVDPSVRFVGLVRDFQYSDNPPTVQTTARGYLTRAIEYENHEETFNNPWLGAGGILIGDIVGGTGSGASNVQDSATIIRAVLDKALVPYNPADIGGTSLQYGAGLDPKYFLWHSGGTAGPLRLPNPQEAGETAMTYIERYDAIDAEVVGTNTGGRYRTFEGLGGTVKRQRIGGRPQGTPNATLTEGIHILSGNFTRSITQTRNNFVVKGQFSGLTGRYGFLAFEVQSSNPFQPSTEQHTYSMSSDMIERQNNDLSDPLQAPDGMSCETLANALELEYNREFVTGWLETWRDDAFDVAQTHLVQGGPGGTIGSLGLAENVWVQSLDITVDERGFTQRITYLGGGLPES